MRPDVTIAILTYNRPEGLSDTLASCRRQTNKLGLRTEIVVIDNHPSQNGAEVVNAHGGEAAGIRYLSDLSRNMSVLRNRAFDAAEAPLVAFIDDDEIADEKWLDELVGTLRATGAAIAVGLRAARFADGKPPAYDPTGSGFTRDLKLADKAFIPLVSPSGKPNFGLGTGNSLFDLEKCFGDGEPMMRESFGNAGGEDAELFVRLFRKGRTIAWAANAFVTETVAPHRTEIQYRSLRTRREAQHYMTIYLDGTSRPTLTFFEMVCKGVVQVILGVVVQIITLEPFSNARITGRMLFANGIGKLTWKKPVGFISE